MRPLLALLLLASPSLAQTGAFVPGYVVPTAGDTLRGEVAVQTDFEAAQGVTFRPGPSEPATTYAPFQLHAYGDAEGRRFVSHPAPAAPEAEPALSFLQVLAEGPLSLLRLVPRPSETVWFVRLGADEPQGLYRVVERVQSDGQSAALRTREPFRAVLAGALFACDSVRDRAFTVDLAERDLLALVRAYNACLGYETVEAPLRDRRSSFAFSVTPRIGVGTTTRLRDVPPVGPGQVDVDLETEPQTGLLVGAQVEQVFLYVPNRLSLLGELSVQHKSGVEYANIRLGTRYAVPTSLMWVHGGLGVTGGRVVRGDVPCGAVRCGTGPGYEGGVFAEAGVEVPSGSGPFVLSVLWERTSYGGLNPIGVIPGASNRPADVYNSSLTLVLGKRFGR